MFGKRKRNLFKLNLRDKFSPIKHDKIKFHLFITRGMRFVRKQNRDEWKISPRNFTVRPTSFQNHPRVYLFPEFSLFPYFFEPSHARSIFPSTNWNSFPKDRNDGRNMDLDFYSRYEGIRSRTAARFNWISSVARLEFDFYFARESDSGQTEGESECHWFHAPPHRTSVDLASTRSRSDLSDNREKEGEGFLCSKIKFPFPTFYLLGGGSLSPTSTSKLHFPRVWSSRNARSTR